MNEFHPLPVQKISQITWNRRWLADLILNASSWTGLVTTPTPSHMIATRKAESLTYTCTKRKDYSYFQSIMRTGCFRGSDAVCDEWIWHLLHSSTCQQTTSWEVSLGQGECLEGDNSGTCQQTVQLGKRIGIQEERMFVSWVVGWMLEENNSANGKLSCHFNLKP